MTVRRFRRKPDSDDRADQIAARYEPGQPADDLRAVARKADYNAELAEVTFPSGAQVLAVRWLQVPDDRPAKTRYEFVESGEFLAYSAVNDSLYCADEANWRQFYDEVPSTAGP